MTMKHAEHVWTVQVDSSRSEYFVAAAQIYCSTFSLQDREPVRVLAERLDSESAAGPNALHIDVFGTGAKFSGNTKAIAVYHYMSNSNSGLLSFLAVKKAFRGMGYGSRLYSVVKRRIKLDGLQRQSLAPTGIFCEVRKDQPHNPNDHTFDFWKQNNTFPISMEWLHPRISSEDTITSLTLLFSPLVRSYRHRLPSAFLARAVEDIYQIAYRKPLDDPLLARVRESIKKTHYHTLLR